MGEVLKRAGFNKACRNADCIARISGPESGDPRITMGTWEILRERVMEASFETDWESASLLPEQVLAPGEVAVL